MNPLDHLFLRFRRDGDPEALAQVFDRAAPALLALALQLCSDPADAEDALQATFVTAIDKAAAYDAGRPLQAWLGGILTLHCRRLHERRRRRRERELTDRPADAPSPPAEAGRREQLATLRRHVERLPAEQRQVLLLQLRHGLSPVEIGEVLGVLPGTVRMRIHRGLRALRRLLPAGLASLVGGMFAVRGLPAVRQAVLARAGLPDATAVAVGSVLLVKRLLAVAILLLLALIGYVFAPGGAEPAGAGAAEATPQAAAAPAARELPAAAAGARERVDQGTAPVVPAPSALAIQVVRAADGTGVAQVGVAVERDGQDPRLLSLRGVTGDDGWLRLPGLEPGSVCVRLDRPRLDGGSPDHRAEIPVELLAGVTRELRLELPEGLTARGRVVDPEGARVPFAELWLDRQFGDPGVFRIGTTDAFGEFELRELPIRCFLGAQHPDFAPSWALLVDAGGGPLELRLPSRGAELRGTVLGPGGGPVAGALVTAGGGTGDRVAPDGTPSLPWQPRRVRTCGQGCFVARGLAAGELELAVHAAGLLPHARSVATVAGETTAVTVHLEAGAVVAGVVSAPSGEPVAGASVRCRGFTPVEAAGSRTAADGSFRLTTLNPARLSLAVSATGHRDYEGVRTAAPGSTVQWNVTLQPQPVLRGRLLDARGAPLHDWQVRATAANARAVRTDRDGRFAVAQHEDDPLELWLAQPRGVWFPCDWLAELPVDREFEVVVDDARLPAAFVCARVVHHDGAPWSGYASVQQADGRWVANVVVAGGELRAGPLAAGEYALKFSSDGQWAGDAVTASVAHAATADLGEIRLAPRGRLTVRVRRSDGAALHAPRLFLHQGGREHSLPIGGDGTGSADLPAGDYRFTLMAGNARWGRGTLTVAAGTASERTLTAGPGTRRWVSLPVPEPAGWGRPRSVHCVLRDPSGNEYLAFDFGAGEAPPHRLKPAVWPGVWTVELTLDDGRRFRGTFAVQDLAESPEPVLVAVPRVR